MSIAMALDALIGVHGLIRIGGGGFRYPLIYTWTNCFHHLNILLHALPYSIE